MRHIEARANIYMKGEELQSVHQHARGDNSNPPPRNKDEKENRDPGYDRQGRYQGRFQGGKGKDHEWTRH